MKTSPPKERGTILIVEDEKNVFNVLSEIFSSDNYVTVWAENGNQAVNIAARIRPNLVILDLNLPDCNGIQVLGELKAMDKDIQVIILTGFGSQDTVRSAMEIGAYDYLTKPFDYNELRAVVREALESECALGRNMEGRHAR